MNRAIKDASGIMVIVLATANESVARWQMSYDTRMLMSGLLTPVVLRASSTMTHLVALLAPVAVVAHFVALLTSVAVVAHFVALLVLVAISIVLNFIAALVLLSILASVLLCVVVSPGHCIAWHDHAGSQ